MATPKLYEVACKGTHLPDDDGSDENFVYGGPENADGSLSEDLGIAWVAGDGGTRDHGNNDVVLIHNLTGVNGLYGDHGSSILEFSVENFPAFPQPESNAVATESLEIAHEGFLGDSKGVINWFSGDGGTIGDPGIFPTETTRPMESDGRDDGWCMGTEIDFPESVHALYDLVV